MCIIMLLSWRTVAHSSAQVQSIPSILHCLSNLNKFKLIASGQIFISAIRALFSSPSMSQGVRLVLLCWTHTHLPGLKKSHTDVFFDDYVLVQSWHENTHTYTHSVSWSLQDKILPGAVLTAARNAARTPPFAYCRLCSSISSLSV